MVATSPSMRSHSWSEVNSVVMKLPLAFIGVGNEGHGCDQQRQALAAHFGKDLRAESRSRRRQIAHRDGSVEARAKTARGDLADGLGRRRIGKQAGAFAHRRAAFRPQANAAARRALFKLRENSFCTGETASACAA